MPWKQQEWYLIYSFQGQNYLRNTNVTQGTDIPDIEQVIQFGVPISLAVWTQCAGCAGQSPQIQAKAILLVEKSMFKFQKHFQRGEKDKPDPLPKPKNDSSDEESDYNETEEKEWVKKVEEGMRNWIESKDCCRDVSDEYFGNPPCRKGNKYNQIELMRWLNALQHLILPSP